MLIKPPLPPLPQNATDEQRRCHEQHYRRQDVEALFVVGGTLIAIIVVLGGLVWFATAPNPFVN